MDVKCQIVTLIAKKNYLTIHTKNIEFVLTNRTIFNTFFANYLKIDLKKNLNELSYYLNSLIYNIDLPPFLENENTLSTKEI